MGNTKDRKSSCYTDKREEVFKSEKDYINARREINHLEKLSDIKDSLGICFSGGGIRSATLCLGIMQKFMKANLFKLFDFLSTVSGGGYIGSCLTSLLSKPDCYPFEDKFEIGIEPNNSPFVGLNRFDDDRSAECTRLGVRHQLHHLRTHGDYLISRKDILSRDLQRAIGTILTGILHHLILFGLLMVSLTAFMHFFLFSITKYPASIGSKQGEKPRLLRAVPFISEFNYLDDTYYKITDTTLHFLKGDEVPENVINQLLPLKDQVFYKGRDNFLSSLDSKNIDPKYQKLIEEYAGIPNDSQLDYVTNELKTWLFARLGIPLYKMLYNGFQENLIAYLVSFFIGIILCYVAFRRVETVKNRIYKAGDEVVGTAKSGFNVEDHFESKFILRLNSISSLIVGMGILLYGIFNSTNPEPDAGYLSVLFLPLGFGFGTAFLSLILSNWMRSRRIEKDRVRRSLYNAIQGASFYCVILSVFIPISLVFLFSINYFKLKFWWVLISLALSYFFFKKAGSGGNIKKFLAKFYKFLLMLLLIVFASLVFNLVSDMLIRNVYPKWSIVLTLKGWGTNLVPLVICILSSIGIYLLGIFVNSNRVSPHYFYRDRLTEAYLKTDARVLRGKKNKNTHQGMSVVSVRNHEDLKLSELGNNNGRGPYHIIVAALNLQGSDELNRKTMLSEHFIFSKNYVGSKVTGYVKTDHYRNDETKLARAMTISAAAAGSAMGLYSFGSQAFATTLFNVRLGYWMANPWYYLKDAANPESKRAFWPWWLMLEMLNKLTARGRMVNLSDGGHTGDNLGLLPLLQRRCKVIVVCDGEADADYSFNSFNNAVRMAYIEENIEIDINLSPIVPKKKKDGSYKFSKESVAIGTITYPPIKEGELSTQGMLIYLKSSMSESKELLPVHVKNYHKTNPNFPHQSTADQFFDDAQFEAYRALGEHIADQAIQQMSMLTIR